MCIQPRHDVDTNRLHTHSVTEAGSYPEVGTPIYPLKILLGEDRLPCVRSAFRFYTVL